MSPEERQLLNGLFDRTRTAAAAPRDPEAEALISDQVKAQPYAPYLLAQAVIVQDQALRAANDKLQELQAKVEEFEQQQGRGQQPPAGGGFLSGLGSLFGAGNPPPPPPQRGPAPGGPGPWGQQPPQQGFGQQNYAPPPPQQQSPWGANAPQGGSFLTGARGAAAGVAGGVLLADGIRNLFGGHNNPLGIGGMNPGMGGGETVVNNYYESDNPGASQADYGNDVDDASYDDDDSGPDDSYDV
jgi:hypothetical protein